MLGIPPFSSIRHCVRVRENLSRTMALAKNGLRGLKMIVARDDVGTKFFTHLACDSFIHCHCEIALASNEGEKKGNIARQKKADKMI